MVVCEFAGADPLNRGLKLYHNQGIGIPNRELAGADPLNRGLKLVATTVNPPVYSELQEQTL